MPHPRAKIRDVLTALLLALAVTLVWPTGGNSHGHSAHSGPHHLMAVGLHAAGHAPANHDPLAACAADLGCCVMTHCHPGVAQPPLGMPQAGVFPGHEPSVRTDEAGAEPAILVPPPRALLA